MKKVLVLALVFFIRAAYACTAFQIKAQDGSMIYGRSMEFGFKFDSNLLIVPRGFNYTGTAPQGAAGLQWTTKYGFIGMNQVIARTVVSDGMNEKGLIVSMLYLPGFAKYETPKTEKNNRTIGAWEFATLLLSTCSTVEEVKALLPTILVAQEPMPNLGEFILPLHYYVADRNGQNLVIEYVDGQRNVYDNPMGTLTNSPIFPWHLQNLACYVNLSPDTIKQLQLPHWTIRGSGQGSGLLGLPGDYTPPSRFVRAVLFSQWAQTPKDSMEGVNTCFHILNTFDIVPGVIRTQATEKSLGTLPAEVKNTMGPDTTEWVIVHDQAHLKTFFRTYGSLQIGMVDLNQLDFSKPELRQIPLSQEFKFEDVTSKSIPFAKEGAQSR